MTIRSGIIIRMTFGTLIVSVVDNMEISDERYEVVDLSGGLLSSLASELLAPVPPFHILSSGVWPH